VPRASGFPLDLPKFNICWQVLQRDLSRSPGKTEVDSEIKPRPENHSTDIVDFADNVR
jgi:hypothetical protein